MAETKVTLFLETDKHGDDAWRGTAAHADTLDELKQTWGWKTYREGLNPFQGSKCPTRVVEVTTIRKVLDV